MPALLEGVHLFPQTLINVKVQDGTDWKQHSKLTAETRAVEGELGSRGRVLIRASGTEPVLRIMVEADDALLARRSAERLAAALT